MFYVHLPYFCYVYCRSHNLDSKLCLTAYTCNTKVIRSHRHWVSGIKCPPQPSLRYKIAANTTPIPTGMRTIFLLGSTISVKLLANRPMPYSTPPNTLTAKEENIKTKTPREKMKRNDFPVSICRCSLKF